MQMEQRTACLCGDPSNVSDLLEKCYPVPGPIHPKLGMRQKKQMIFDIDISEGLDIRSPTGDQIEISSRKGRLLLACLCLSKDLSCKRDWLLQRLWGSRSLEQGRNSLRQELFGLKKILNADGVVLVSDKTTVGLQDRNIRIRPVRSLDTLMDWARLPDEPAFEAWLRDLRRAAVFRQARQELNFNSIEAGQATFFVELTFVDRSGDGLGASVIEGLRAELAEAFGELGGITIVQSPRPGSATCYPDLHVEINAIPYGEGLRVTAFPRRYDNGQLLRPVSCRINTDSHLLRSLPVVVEQFSNEVVDHVQALIGSFGDSLARPMALATKSAYLGVNSLFSRQFDAATSAQFHLDQAVELSENSSILAWRAYLTALHLEEAAEDQHSQLRENARADIQKALSIDPTNGLTAALAAQVFGFVLDNFEQASKCLKTAIEKRPGHVMTQDAAALFSFYKGDLKSARRAAFRAEHYGRHLPHQYCFSTSLLMIEALDGNYRAGIRHGERALELMPKGRVRPYPPTLRYLAICHAQLGRVEKSRRLFGDLDRMEGQLSGKNLRRSAALMPSEDARELMIDSLIKIGR